MSLSRVVGLAKHAGALGLVYCLGLTLSGAAQASGDDTVKTPTCPKGQVWNSESKACVSEQSQLSDPDLVHYAYALAKAKRYDEALGVLNLLKNPDTAEALNYRGYATRKLGRTEEGIGYYLKAVDLDPHYSLVREYLGEAYVIQGRTDLAQAQLQVIEGLCGNQCEEYRDLSGAIQHAEKL